MLVSKMKGQRKMTNNRENLLKLLETKLDTYFAYSKYFK